jgi:hypothetical protein
MVPSDYNGTKKFLWPTGTIAITSQPNALLLDYVFAMHTLLSIISLECIPNLFLKVNLKQPWEGPLGGVQKKTLLS